MNDLEGYLQTLVEKVCRDLGGMYVTEEQSSAYGLVFPRKRDGSLRISEQEAKLLFVQHLTVDKRYYFCVETPTTETYIQKGTTPMSARVDVTLLGNDRKPIAHVEQKAHNCTLESIRKDLEKLLRERSTGCWFHTIERADHVTLQVLLAKFRAAFSLLPDCLGESRSSYLFAFFVLDTARLIYQWLHFTGDKTHNESAVNSAFGEPLDSSGWQTLCFRAKEVTDARQTQPSSAGKGQRHGYLIFAPALVANTFVHLSIRGGSYRIRKYNLDDPMARPHIVRADGYASVDSLRKSGVITHFISVTAEDLKHNLDDDPQYWCERIRKLNIAHLSSMSSMCEGVGTSA